MSGGASSAAKEGDVSVMCKVWIFINVLYSQGPNSGGASGAAKEGDVSVMCNVWIFIYVLYSQGPNSGVVSPRKSWNTLMNEDGDKCDGAKDN